MMSGTRAEKFRSGWALRVMTWGKAHFYERADIGLATSLCGRSSVPAGQLHHAGNWSRCQACERKAEKA